jgi:hypothetical protein
MNSALERLKKFAGLSKDNGRCPPNPSFTVRECIEIADELELVTKQRFEYAEAFVALWVTTDRTSWDDTTIQMLDTMLEEWEKLNP